MENSENEETAEKWQVLLADLAENPVTLNTATKETLESIPFLNGSQVEALSYYIYRYGPIVSLSELMLVDGIDEQTLRWLKPFVCLGEAIASPLERLSMKKAFKFGKQEICMRLGRSVQKRLGYLNTLDSTQFDNSYLGDPNCLYFRYGFNYKEKMQWGFVLEKDSGEKLWSKKSNGIDYTSFHFLLKNQKKIKSLIVGDYHIRFGQGLVCANSFSLGKSAIGTALEQTGTNLSRHFSASESGFFRGIAATYILKPYVWKNSKAKARFGLEVTTFASTRNLDAKITDKSFTTISSVELHRTEAESNIKDKLKMYTLGTHISLRINKGQFGLTGLSYGFNAYWNPEWKPYNCFYFRGKHGGNLSIDYLLRFKGMLFFGELAVDEKKNKAIISGISFKPYSNLDISLLGRNYAPEYNAYFANAFSEGTFTKNEHGFFATIEWRCIKKIRINAYCDIFVFPWLKYEINSLSAGTDYTFQTTWSPSSGSQVIFRYKSKVKDKNENNSESVFTAIESQLKNQIRLQISSVHGFWTLKSVIDCNKIEKRHSGIKTLGFAASQEVNYVPKKNKASFSIKYTLFDTEDFENRIYSYEKDIPSVFSMSSFYGKGSRLSLLLKYKITKKISMQAKIGHSFYRDRDQVGTALEQVEGNQLTDIRGLFLCKF